MDTEGSLLLDGSLIQENASLIKEKARHHIGKAGGVLATLECWIHVTSTWSALCCGSSTSSSTVNGGGHDPGRMASRVGGRHESLHPNHLLLRV